MPDEDGTAEGSLAAEREGCEVEGEGDGAAASAPAEGAESLCAAGFPDAGEAAATGDSPAGCAGCDATLPSPCGR